VLTTQIVIAGGIAGVLSNITGYAITGRLFHRYQARTPNTWRAAESWGHYLYSAGVRVLACVGIALLYHAYGAANPTFASGALAVGAGLGVCLWAVTVVPVIVEVALFVNWHRGFVVGLLLDWLIVCVMASVAASVTERAA
jgi:hypothetical protein